MGLHDDMSATPYPELNRAAGAGLRLVAARNRFRRSACLTLGALAASAERLDRVGYLSPRHPVRTAFDAAHDSYARFVYAVETRWEDEDGFVELSGRGFCPRRSRLDDIRDGRLAPEAGDGEVSKVFQESARAEFGHDRPAAQRLLCIGLLWSVDLRHESEDPDWARRQGVFPGAEAAPTLSRLLTELAYRTEAPAEPLACALREAGGAVGRISGLARIFGSACCCEFEYEAVFASEAA